MSEFEVVAQDHTVDRRRVIKGLAGSSFGLAAVFAWTAERASAGRSRRRRPVEFDVACLGATFRLNSADGANVQTGELYGSTFLVEGNLYPKGTIPRGPGFDPASARATGHWFCYSVLTIGSGIGRTQPHILGHQQYVFGRLESNPFPRNQIVSHGFEEADPPNTVTNLRAITGGIGRHNGARGTARQTQIGTNTTEILGGPAPNFRFRLDLL